MVLFSTEQESVALADPMSIPYGLSLVASNPHMLPARRLMEEM